MSTPAGKARKKARAAGKRSWFYLHPGKLFAGLPAAISGLAMPAVAGVVLAPLLHRMLHRFHVDETEPSSQ